MNFCSNDKFTSTKHITLSNQVKCGGKIQLNLPLDIVHPQERMPMTRDQMLCHSAERNERTWLAEIHYTLWALETCSSCDVIISYNQVSIHNLQLKSYYFSNNLMRISTKNQQKASRSNPSWCYIHLVTSWHLVRFRKRNTSR